MHCHPRHAGEAVDDNDEAHRRAVMWPEFRSVGAKELVEQGEGDHQTLAQNTTTKVPTFAGRAGEDFRIFKDRFENGCPGQWYPGSSQAHPLSRVMLFAILGICCEGGQLQTRPSEALPPAQLAVQVRLEKACSPRLDCRLRTR
jgi:hypothetical protein